MYSSTSSAASSSLNAGLLFIVAAALCVFIVVVIMAMWKVFTKAGRPGWASLIPLYNSYVLLKIINRPGWWLILLFIPIVNFILSIVIALDLAKVFGKSQIFGLVALWLFGGIGYLILGFGNAQYIGQAQTSGGE